MRKKRFLGILLTLALLLTLLPGMSLTAYADDYPLWVGGVQVTSANLTIDSQDNEAISGSAVYDDSTNTLTLTNFSYTGPGYAGDWGEGGGIDYRGSDLTIVLEGTNSITKSGDNEIDCSHGIYFAGGTLTIDGSGSLTIGFDSSRQGWKSNGIFCEPGAFVMNGGTVVSNAGRGDESAGIYTQDGITFNGGSFTGNGYYTTDYESRGIYSNGTITVNGGTVTGTAPLDNDNDAYGFDNGGGVTLNGGDLTAIGKPVFSDMWGFGGGAGTKLRILAGSDADSAALVDSIPEDANYVQIQVLYNVTITPGSNMTKTTDSGAQSQTALYGAMTDVVYTADDGYYFPENYSVEAVNGISVTRDSFTQITISGTPTANAAITLTPPTAKTTPDAPATVAAVDCTSTDSNDGKLTGVTTAMEYKKSDADSWTDGTGNDITGLVPGTYYVRVKATDTTNASANRELTIAVSTVPVTGVSLDKTAAQTIDVDDTVSFTASIEPEDATDKTVLWSVGGTNTDAVALYSDEDCTVPVGTDATEILTVYAKGISSGTATVTVTSNDDNTITASCAVTVIVPVPFGTPDFTMPAALSTIGESAFEGMPLLHIADADSVTSVGRWAFKDTGLTQISLPANCAIDADAFTGCGTVYIFAPAGGTTEDWCRDRTGIVFIAQ